MGPKISKMVQCNGAHRETHPFGMGSPLFAQGNWLHRFHLVVSSS